MLERDRTCDGRQQEDAEAASFDRVFAPVTGREAHAGGSMPSRSGGFSPDDPESGETLEELRHPIRREATVTPTRILILGGGFGGVEAARRFERLLRRRADVEVTLVSRDNFFLFTPMLHE